MYHIRKAIKIEPCSGARCRGNVAREGAYHVLVDVIIRQSNWFFYLKKWKPEIELLLMIFYLSFRCSQCNHELHLSSYIGESRYGLDEEKML